MCVAGCELGVVNAYSIRDRSWFCRGGVYVSEAVLHNVKLTDKGQNCATKQNPNSIRIGFPVVNRIRAHDPAKDYLLRPFLCQRFCLMLRGGFFGIQFSVVAQFSSQFSR